MANKKLQLAVDVLSTAEALEIVSEVGSYADIIEVGTPLIVAEGAHAYVAGTGHRTGSGIDGQTRGVSGGREHGSGAEHETGQDGTKSFLHNGTPR